MLCSFQNWGTGTPILTPCFSCIYISTLTVPIHFVLCCCGCQQPQPADWLAQSCSCTHGSFLPSCFLFFWVFYFFCIMSNHVFRFFLKTIYLFGSLSSHGCHGCHGHVRPWKNWRGLGGRQDLLKQGTSAALVRSFRGSKMDDLSDDFIHFHH